MSLVFYAAAATPAMSESRSDGDGRQVEDATHGSTGVSFRILPAPGGGSEPAGKEPAGQAEAGGAHGLDMEIAWDARTTVESGRGVFVPDHENGAAGSGTEGVRPESGKAPAEGTGRESTLDRPGPPASGRLPFTGAEARALLAGAAGGLSAVILGALLIRLSARRGTRPASR
ncbi:hypothetical protein PYR91_07635 [Sphaerisporangium sp. TRM90804]|nr:hypothetical protein [Sphaerisporangium sp. TRM90804]